MNFDAFVFSEVETDLIGMVIRDQMGRFIEIKNARVQEPDLVFATELRIVCEDL